MNTGIRHKLSDTHKLQAMLDMLRANNDRMNHHLRHSEANAAKWERLYTYHMSLHRVIRRLKVRIYGH